jgi:hypothetical protein
MEKGVLARRSLRKVLDLPPELKDTKEIVLGAVSNLEQRTFGFGVFSIE